MSEHSYLSLRVFDDISGKPIGERKRARRDVKRAQRPLVLFAFALAVQVDKAVGGQVLERAAGGAAGWRTIVASSFVSSFSTRLERSRTRHAERRHAVERHLA